MARMNWSDYEGPGFNSCWFAASATELNCLKSTTPSRCIRSFCETDENMTWRFNSGGIFPTNMSTVVLSLLLQPWPFFAAFLSSSCICNFQIGLSRTWRAPFHGWTKELSLPNKLSLQNVTLNQTQHVVNEAEFLPGWWMPRSYLVHGFGVEYLRLFCCSELVSVKSCQILQSCWASVRHKPAGYVSCFDYSFENPVPDGKSTTKPFKFSKPRICFGLPLTLGCSLEYRSFWCVPGYVDS